MGSPQFVGRRPSLGPSPVGLENKHAPAREPVNIALNVRASAEGELDDDEPALRIHVDTGSCCSRTAKHVSSMCSNLASGAKVAGWGAAKAAAGYGVGGFIGILLEALAEACMDADEDGSQQIAALIIAVSGTGLIGGTAGWRAGELVGYRLGAKGAGPLLLYKMGGVLFTVAIPLYTEYMIASTTDQLSRLVFGTVGRMIGQFCRDWISVVVFNQLSGSIAATPDPKNPKSRLEPKDQECFDLLRTFIAFMVYSATSLVHQGYGKDGIGDALGAEHGAGIVQRLLSNLGPYFSATVGEVVDEAPPMEAAFLAWVKDYGVDYQVGEAWNKQYPPGHKPWFPNLRRIWDNILKNLSAKDWEKTWELIRDHAAMRIAGFALPEAIYNYSNTFPEWSAERMKWRAVAAVLQGLTEWRFHFINYGGKAEKKAKGLDPNEWYARVEYGMSPEEFKRRMSLARMPTGLSTRRLHRVEVDEQKPPSDDATKLAHKHATDALAHAAAATKLAEAIGTRIAMVNISGGAPQHTSWVSEQIGAASTRANRWAIMAITKADAFDVGGAKDLCDAAQRELAFCRAMQDLAGRLPSEDAASFVDAVMSVFGALDGQGRGDPVTSIAAAAAAYEALDPPDAEGTLKALWHPFEKQMLEGGLPENLCSARVAQGLYALARLSDVTRAQVNEGCFASGLKRAIDHIAASRLTEAAQELKTTRERWGLVPSSVDGGFHALARGVLTGLDRTKLSSLKTVIRARTVGDLHGRLSDLQVLAMTERDPASAAKIAEERAALEALDQDLTMLGEVVAEVYGHEDELASEMLHRPSIADRAVRDHFPLMAAEAEQVREQTGKVATHAAGVSEQLKRSRLDQAQVPQWDYATFLAAHYAARAQMPGKAEKSGAVSTAADLFLQALTMFQSARNTGEIAERRAAAQMWFGRLLETVAADEWVVELPSTDLQGAAFIAVADYVSDKLTALNDPKYALADVVGEWRSLLPLAQGAVKLAGGLQSEETVKAKARLVDALKAQVPQRSKIPAQEQGDPRPQFIELAQALSPQGLFRVPASPLPLHSRGSSANAHRRNSNSSSLGKTAVK